MGVRNVSSSESSSVIRFPARGPLAEDRCRRLRIALNRLRELRAEVSSEIDVIQALAARPDLEDGGFFEFESEFECAQCCCALRRSS